MRDSAAVRRSDFPKPPQAQTIRIKTRPIDRMNPLFIIFGAITIISVAGMLTGVVIEWIKSRKEASVVNDEAFLDALREFKQKTDRRLTALESENRTLEDRLARFEAADPSSKSNSPSSAGATATGAKSKGDLSSSPAPRPAAPSSSAAQPTQRMEDAEPSEDEAGRNGGTRLRNMLR